MYEPTRGDLEITKNTLGAIKEEYISDRISELNKLILEQALDILELYKNKRT